MPRTGKGVSEVDPHRAKFNSSTDLFFRTLRRGNSHLLNGTATDARKFHFSGVEFRYVIPPSFVILVTTLYVVFDHTS